MEVFIDDYVTKSKGETGAEGISTASSCRNSYYSTKLQVGNSQRVGKRRVETSIFSCTHRNV